MRKSKNEEVIIEEEHYEKDKIFKIDKRLRAILVILYFFTFNILIYVPFILLDIDIKNIPDILYYMYYFSTEFLLIVSVIWIYRDDFKKYWDDFKINGLKHMKFSINWWLIGVAIMIVSNILISQFSPVSLPENEEAVRDALKLSPIFMVISTIIDAPIIEEILFRKTLFDMIKNKKLYIIVSGLIFGAFHIIGVGKELASWLYVIPYAALGMTFAYILVKTKNLLATIGIHAFHNFITIIEIFLLF